MGVGSLSTSADRRSSQFPIPNTQFRPSSTRAVIGASFLLRAGQSAASVVIGLYLIHLRRTGLPVAAVVASLLLTSSYAVELFLASPMGALSDRFGRKPFMVAGPLVGLLALQVYPVSGALAVLFLARGLEGVAAAVLTPATLGFLADVTPPPSDASGSGRRGKTMAYYEIATLVGIGSGYAVGGVLWQHLAEAAFRAVSGLYLLSALVVVLWVAGGQQVLLQPAISLRQRLAVVRQPAVLRFAPAWLCVTAIIGLWFNNLVFQLGGPRREGQLLGGFSGNQVSLIMGLFVVVLIAGTFGWSRLFDRVCSKTTIMLVAMIGLLVLCAALLGVNQRGDDSAVWLFGLLPVVVAGVALESGFTPAALAYLADITEPFAADRGAIMGLYSIILSIGEVAGGVAGGPFAQAWGLNGMVGLTIALTLAALAVVIGLRRAEVPRGASARMSYRISPQ